MIKESETPLPLVRQTERAFPGIWDDLDRLKNCSWDDSLTWPQECDIPIGAAFTLLVDKYGYTPVQAAEYAGEITACYTWRKHKVVYQFDPDLARELQEQALHYKDEDALPVETILRPPYPCTYIKCPGVLDEHVDGFFAYIEWDVNRNIYEFRANLMTRDMAKTFTMALELHQPTLAECIAATIGESARNAQRPLPIPSVEDMQMLLTALNMSLYISSAESDIVPNPEHARITRRSPIIRDKYREIEVQDVGVRIGSTLRQAWRASSSAGGVGTGTGSKKRAHTRRGHWHHYWTGPKATPEQRRLVLKWTHPVLVGGDKDYSVVIHPVK